MNKKVWMVIVFLLLAGAGLYFVYGKKSKSDITYTEATVHKGELDLSILATGTVQPENRLEIKPPIAGRVEQVLVKEGQRVSRGMILAWMSSSERAALLDAARAQGAEEVKKWEDLYKPTPIMAPISGTIIQRKVESGQSFTNTEAILVMSDRLSVQAQVDETDISQIKVGQSAEVVLDAYSSEAIEAKVTQIAFEATTVNSVTTYIVDVVPVRTPEQMRSGMTANVKFKVQNKNNVLLLPMAAVTYTNQTAQVKVPGEKQKPTDRSIQVGLSDGTNIEVISGLTEGEKVLIPQINFEASQSASSPLSPFGGRKPGGLKGGSSKSGSRGGH